MMVSTFAADNADEVIHVETDNKLPIGELAVSYRPHVHEFLKYVKSRFELIVYSSFNGFFLDGIINSLERMEKFFVHRFDEDFCLFANISYSIKCLDFLLANRSLADIIMIDQTVRALPLTPDNLIPISAYDSLNPADEELPKLAILLDLVASAPDVRVAIRTLRSKA